MLLHVLRASRTALPKPLRGLSPALAQDSAHLPRPQRAPCTGLPYRLVRLQQRRRTSTGNDPSNIPANEVFHWHTSEIVARLSLVTRTRDARGVQTGAKSPG